MKRHRVRTVLWAIVAAGLVPAWWVETAVAGSETVPVSVRVVGPSGEVVAGEVYASIRRLGASPAQVLDEALVHGGAAVPEWSVEPGQYIVVCSAEGHAVASRRVPVREVDRCEVRVDLPTLDIASVRVTSPDGLPIGDAEVGPARAFFPDSPWRGTDLFEAHARGIYVVRSGTNGVAKLPVVPGTKVSLIGRVPGRWFGFVPDVGVDELRRGAYRLSLTRAGSFLVRLRAESAADPSTTVFLRPVGAPWEDLRFYYRSPARGERVAFPAIAEGEYEAFLDDRMRARRGDAPLALGTAVARFGEMTALAEQSEGPPTEARVPGHTCSPLAVRVEAPALPQDVRVYGFDARGGPVRRSSFSTRASGGMSVLEIPDGCCGPGYWVASASGFVSDPIPRSCGIPRDPIALHPAGRVVARVSGVPSTDGPLAGTAALLPCSPETPMEPVRFYPFEVSDSRASLLLPQGCYDTVLRLAGYQEVERRINVAPLHVVDLGEIAMLPAAPLLVRIVDAEDRRPVEGARAALVATDDGRAPAGLDATGLLDGPGSCVADSQGWCRLFVHEPGAYRVLAADEGYATVFGDVVDVARDVGPRQLEDLLLPRAAVLQVSLGAFTATREAGLLLSAENSNQCLRLPSYRRAKEVHGGEVVTWDGLAPGTWSIALTVADLDRVAHEVFTEEIELSPGEGRTVDLAANRPVIRGTVSYRNQGLAAMLFFTRADARGEGAFTNSDTDGRFDAAVPGSGRYDIVVQCREPRLDVGLRNVMVREDQSVRLVVPGGRIEGTVLDERHLPVGGATVTAEAYAPEEPARRQRLVARTDSVGFFAVDGVNDGGWSLRARLAELSSDATDVRVDNEQTVSGVQLTLRQPEDVTVRVESVAGTPIVGARVHATLVGVSAFEPIRGLDRTADARGEFHLPRTGGLANLEIDAGPAGLHARRVYLSDDARLILSPLLGSLVVEGAGGEPLGERVGFMVLRSQAGALLVPTRWRAFATGPMSLSGLTAGSWTVLELPHYDPAGYRALLEGTAPGNAVCRAVVEPGEVADCEVSK